MASVYRQLLSRGKRRTRSLPVPRLDAYLRPVESIVPAGSLSHRSLTLVIAIMTFLVCLAVAGVLVTNSATEEWKSEIGSQFTVQVSTLHSDDIDRDTKNAFALLVNEPGLANVTILTREQSAALVQPWLGDLAQSDLLPVPRVITAQIVERNRIDLKRLRAALTASVPTALIDDHSIWSNQLSVMSSTVTYSALAIMLLLLIAMMLSVVSATRAALSSNQTIVSVLHFVGASDRYIASEFQQHFLSVGLRGGLIGGFTALCVIFSTQSLLFFALPANEPTNLHRLASQLAIGLQGYASLAAVVLFVTGLTAATSRFTVYRLLRQIQT